MLRNNLKLAVRSLVRYRLYSLINLLGLSFGIGGCILVALYAIDELTFDKHHDRADRIHRVIQHRQTVDQGDQYFGAVSYNAGLAARNEIPGVLQSTRLFMWGRAVLRNPVSDRAFYQPFLTSENAIFQIFDFEFLAGQPASALSRPNTVVLVESMANKLFNGENALGKILQSDRGMELEVTGIIKSPPENSHLQFESLISHATIESQSWWNDQRASDWSSQQWATYLLLDDNVSADEVGSKLTAFAHNRVPETHPFEGQLSLQPLAEIHFGSNDFQRELNANKSSYRYLYIFCMIGLFVLCIACINYINLATARAANYAKEVGVRKAVGADNKHLIARFMSESVLLTATAFLLALVAVQLLLPNFNSFTGKTLSLHPARSGWILPVLALIMMVVSTAAGAYPSMYLSRYKPAQVLKGFLQRENHTAWSRKGLVVLQFSISIMMIIGTLLVWQQMRFVSSQDLGFDQEHLVVVDINSGFVRSGFEVIKQNYLQLPAVSAVSVSSRVPGEWKNLIQVKAHAEAGLTEPGQIPWYMGVDEDFLSTFNIDLHAGRNFRSQPHSADSTSVILNRSAAKVFGITEVDEQELILVSRINNGAEFPLNIPHKVRVIGIVEDFNFQSLYEPIEPLVLAHHTSALQSIDYFTARISGEKIEQTIVQMTEILHQIDPDHLFEYHLLDDQIDHFYRADQQRGTLFSLAALCAIFIACLGLFGLATFTSEQRSKEIGIRKVLGASVIGIVSMLSKDFIKLVFIALFFAAPLAYWMMEKWLDNFAYRINIKWWVFALAGIVAIAIALGTVSYQSIRAAVANPIKALRDE